jgi:tRNA(fMet)-specific endonuclease VapC
VKYLLDTNICIYVIKKQPATVIEKIQSEPLEDICISTITLAELEHGVAKSALHERNRLALLEFLTPFRILDFDQAAAQHYGLIRSDLESRGVVIGPLDLLIAAHAQSKGLTLVTNNLREFQRIKDLKMVNWV